MLTIEFETFFKMIRAHACDARLGCANEEDDILPMQSDEESFTEAFLEPFPSC